MAQAETAIVSRVREFLRRLNQICPIETGVLFGSCTTGRRGKDSDIDLAIFSREANERNILALTALFLKESAYLKLDIQPLVFPYEDYISENNEFVTTEIKNKGILVLG